MTVHTHTHTQKANNLHTKNYGSLGLMLHMHDILQSILDIYPKIIPEKLSHYLMFMAVKHYKQLYQKFPKEPYKMFVYFKNTPTIPKNPKN